MSPSGFVKLGWLKRLNASARSRRSSRSVIGNLRSIDRSTSVNPNPGMSFRASVPCRRVDEIENAFEFRFFPPGAAGFESHNACPGTISGRIKETPKIGDGAKICALKGNPVRATITASSDQFLVRRLTGLVSVTDGRL